MRVFRKGKRETSDKWTLEVEDLAKTLATINPNWYGQGFCNCSLEQHPRVSINPSSWGTMVQMPMEMNTVWRFPSTAASHEIYAAGLQWGTAT
mmetsp:Transcript_44177/g.140404  ORF Transcript_44177/g.140404 Transcript_44177/m.140404 type:complete len:93 (-) Transcript_44177:51-329(-)